MFIDQMRKRAIGRSDNKGGRADALLISGNSMAIKPWPPDLRAELDIALAEVSKI